MTFCELTLWAPTDHYIHGKWIFWSHKMTIFCSKKVQMLSKNTTWSWRCFVLPNTRSVSKNPKTCTKKVFGHSKKQSKQFCSVNILTVNDKNPWFSVSENCQKAWLFWILLSPNLILQLVSVVPLSRRNTIFWQKTRSFLTKSGSR